MSGAAEYRISALVPILLPETRSEALVARLSTDREVVIWWATPLECQSALYRRHRDTPLPSPVMRDMTDRLRAFVEHADTIAPTGEVRRRAQRRIRDRTIEHCGTRIAITCRAGLQPRRYTGPEGPAYTL
jgi:uncharacterized protein with PIN domain